MSRASVVRTKLGPGPRNARSWKAPWPTSTTTTRALPSTTPKASGAPKIDAKASGACCRSAPKGGARAADVAKTIRRSLSLALLTLSVPAFADAPETSAPATHEAAAKEIPQISLEAALKQALDRNPSAKLALLDVKRAESLVAQARAQALPTLTGNGVYTRLDSDREIGGRVINAENQLQLNLLLQVPLIAPRAWSQWSRASENIEVAQASEKSARQVLVIAVARTYLAAIAQERVLEVSERARETAIAHEISMPRKIRTNSRTTRRVRSMAQRPRHRSARRMVW